MAKQKKPTPHAKKPAPKKAQAKKAAPKETGPKKAVAAPAKKPAPKPAPTPKPAETPKPKPSVPSNENKKSTASEKKESARELLRNRILGSKKATKPIAFSLEEVREIAKSTTVTEGEKTAKPVVKTASKTVIDVTKTAKPVQPNHVKAASLADILGFNPKRETKAPTEIDIEAVPEKHRRYYKLLIDLRNHLTEGITLHSEETLKRSAKDDAGDLSSYGQHLADAGTDTFDRDFALSLVSSEQEALTEIDAAIKRIKDGSYGICEITGKPIAKERLSAVPFTRYSADAQKEIERNRMRTRSSAGLFGELGEDGAKIEDAGGDDE